jgi:hypothetical protein
MNKYSKETDVDYISFKNNFKGEKNYDYLDYRDVYRNRPFSNRVTNPLNPCYKINYDGVENVFGEIEKNRPNCFSKFHCENVGKGNRTDDIEGNETNNILNVEKFRKKFNRPLIYSAEDVVGAQAGTLRKGIKTNRCLSPLDPDYQFLGEREEKERLMTENNNFEEEKKIVNKSKSNVNVVRNLSKYYNNNNNNYYNYNKDDRKNDYKNYNNFNKNYSKNINFNSRYVQTEPFIQNYEKVQNLEISIPNKSSNISRNNSNKLIETIKEENEEINNNNLNENKKSVNEIITEKLKNLPYYSDEVKFDKEKYKKPEIYKFVPREKNIIIPSVPTGQSLQNYYKQLKDSQKYYSPFQDQIRYQRLNDKQINKELLNNSYENRLSTLIKKHS